MKRWITIAAAGVIALAGVVAVTQTASAARADWDTIAVNCGEDGTFVVALNRGGGNFTPAFVAGGGVFIPVAFSNLHGEFTPNGGQTETFEDPDSSKGGPRNKDFLNCHFKVEFEEEDGSGFFEGDVKGFIAGH